MTQTKRNSSFELLRIIAIFLIVSYHFVNHSYLTYANYYALTSSDYFIQILYLFGRPACALFALISGYFTVNSKFTKNYYAKIITLFIKTALYSLISLLIYRFIFNFSIDLEDFIESCIFILDHWYIRMYIIIMLLAPFINRLLKSLNKNEFRRLLAINFIIYILLNTFLNYSIDLGDLYFMFFYYIFGAYARLHKNAERKNIHNLYISLGCALLMILSVFCLDTLANILKSDYIFAHALYFKKYNNLLSFGFAYYLFLFFSNIHFENRTINTIASTVLGIYIIHDNRFIRDLIWRKWELSFDFYSNPLMYYLIKVFSVLILCIIIDLLFTNTIEKLINRISYRMIPEQKENP